MFSIGDYVKRTDLQNKIDLKILSEQELKFLQESILDIYRDVLSVCEKAGIRVMMVAGSAIGVVRHKGFIPWDDDIDIFLTRENYKKLIDLLKDDLHYKLYAPETTENYLYGFCKLMDKRTVIYSEYDEEIGTPELGVFIDIYPVDLIPENKKSNEVFYENLIFIYIVRTLHQTRCTHMETQN